MSSYEYAMYILVNQDLEMKKGKIASQVGHVVHMLIKNIERNVYDEKVFQRYEEWDRTGCAKIVLRATTEQLTSLMHLPEAVYIIDAGLTQIPANSLTAVGFCPNTKTNMREITTGYKLL